MSLRFSQGVVNNIGYGMGWGDIIQNGVCVVYSGTQPTTADTAATAGTELVRFTLSGATQVTEKRAWCRILLGSYGSASDVVNMKVNGQSITGGDVTGAATLLALKTAVVNAINNNYTYPDFYAVAAGTTVGSVTYGTAADGEFIVLAPKNTLSTYDAATVLFANTTTTADINNGGTPTTTETGAFASATNGASGGSGANGLGAEVTPANGLRIQYPSVAGLVTIKTGDTWSGTASATGTAGWFRILCNPRWDTGLTNLATTGDSSQLIMRIDGSVGTSGADMIVTSTAITSGVSQTVTSFAMTVPSL